MVTIRILSLAVCILCCVVGTAGEALSGRAERRALWPEEAAGCTLAGGGAGRRRRWPEEAVEVPIAV